LTLNFSKVADKANVDITNNTRLIHENVNKTSDFVKCLQNDAQDDVMGDAKRSKMSTKFERSSRNRPYNKKVISSGYEAIISYLWR